MKMAKMIVTYTEPTNIEGFQEHYFNVHIPLVEKLPNIKNASVQYVKQTMNTDENLYLVAQLEFENLQELGAAMQSQEGQETAGDVANLMPFLAKPPVIAIVE